MREEFVYVLHARSLVHTGEDVVVVEGVGEESFAFLECEAPAEAEFRPGERVGVGEEESDGIDRVRQRFTIDDLSEVARDALDDVVAVLVEENEDRFVEVFNTAGPLSLRRHQLDLLPDIGEARRNQIVEERGRHPFDDFADVTDRVPGLSVPATVVARRIVTELSSEDVDYRLFVE